MLVRLEGGGNQKYVANSYINISGNVQVSDLHLGGYKSNVGTSTVNISGGSVTKISSNRDADKNAQTVGDTTITISGTSNSKKLTFSLASGGTLVLTLPETYLANSLTTNNGAAIQGDPGASAEFPFSIQFTNIPKNPVVTEKSVQLIVTDNAGHTSTSVITQAAGDATLEVSPATVNLDWNAATEQTSASFSVTSNTNWSIE